MKRSVVIVAGFTALGIPFATSASAATIVQSFPVDFTLPAENACGEAIHVSGTLNEVFTATFNSAGGVLFSSQSNPQGVTGVGLTTGTVYQGTGVTRSVTTVNAGQTQTLVNSFKLIGHGKTPNLLETDIFHVTVDANAITEASLVQSTLQCV
jgi:hypothetical protein